MGGGNLDGFRSSSGAALSKYGADILRAPTAITTQESNNMHVFMKLKIVMVRHMRRKGTNLHSQLHPTATLQSVLLSHKSARTLGDAERLRSQAS